MTQTTAPFIIQWSEGGPAGSQAVTLLLSLVGTPPGGEALLFRGQLLAPFVVTGRIATVPAGNEPTDDQTFIFSCDGEQVATLLFPAGQRIGIFSFDTLSWSGAITLTGPSLISDPIADISITIKGAQ